jgi:transcriptional regulator of acetoin/glycerol metabolism
LAKTRKCELRWPGNIRQLETRSNGPSSSPSGNVRRRPPPEIISTVPEAVAAGPTNRLSTRRLRRRLLRSSVVETIVAAPAGLADELDHLERERLSEALVRAAGNKAEAARALGIPRSTLFSKLRKYGLD